MAYEMLNTSIDGILRQNRLFGVDSKLNWSIGFLKPLTHSTFQPKKKPVPELRDGLFNSGKTTVKNCFRLLDDQFLSNGSSCVSYDVEEVNARRQTIFLNDQLRRIYPVSSNQLPGEGSKANLAVND